MEWLSTTTDWLMVRGRLGNMSEGRRGKERGGRRVGRGGERKGEGERGKGRERREGGEWRVK